MKKVAFHTLGCKLNFSETSAISQKFLNNGFEIVDFNSHADVYVVNTCTVTDNADKECRQIVRRALRNNPDAFIAVTGCYAQLRAEEISQIDGVDVVLGSNEKFNIFDYANNFSKNELSCIYVSDTNELNEFHSSLSLEGNERTRAFFKIQDGCDYKCSFCTIPLARGKSRSMNPDEVIKEFKTLLDVGYKEIILTGVNVGDYGLNYNMNLFNLLQRMLKVEGDYRIRISSIEPNLLDDNIIQLTRDNEKMAKHFHIPLQSGSKEILALMQRRYKKENYQELISKVVNTIPNVGIGVDVIVGFPGETDEHFRETYDFIKELPISYLHVFTYSERPNTKAIEMGGNIDISIRKKRNKMLRILSDKKRAEFNRSMIGEEQFVLFEDQNENGIMKGFTESYLRVSHTYNSELINKFTKVKIREANGNICTVDLIEENIQTLAG
ncbi:MAG: tRNA (N(6)-L-threonylcarbamoyladenosine(37)-C(2))-methylthiotransferase MtaB [Melioribacteraceae bacterium]|nr:MAG: tRNA (N(6)-L-threonylcarbamoyladenosine(37)-C(2))-methylthiotransferase MtaB [Ignavibacteriales bacterium]WKZ70445.1 MAG: tRNA (N(6)-L-threonylcarbamoyladenosine(37)-C(2))-methylthiotransferase MtaB [Melioribacteraceae bacterium]